MMYPAMDPLETAPTPLRMHIGIEGPAAAGKSTMAQTVAAELGATVIERGTWYRALTYRAQAERVRPDNTERLVALAEGLQLQVLPGEAGSTRVLLGDDDVTDRLYKDKISSKVGPIAQNLVVREAIEPQIAAEIGRHDRALVIGRHLLQLLPSAVILRLSIDPAEADHRHGQRAGKEAVSVAERNAIDQKTGRLLVPDSDGIATVDVTHLSRSEQADVLRNFIIDRYEAGELA